MRCLNAELAPQSTIACGDGDCSISESVSYTISASIGVAAEWISGGFDVSESIETGSEWTCDGGAGETVCIYKAIPHIAVCLQFARASKTAPT